MDEALMSHLETKLSDAQKLNNSIAGLFEGPLSDAAQISSTLRAIPLKNWAVDISQDFGEAYVLVRATVYARSLLSEVILRHTVKPSEAGAGFEDDFYGAARYTVKADEQPRHVKIDRPELVKQLIGEFLPLLGEQKEYASRFERAKLQAKQYRDDLQWAIDTLNSMIEGEIKVSELPKAAAVKMAKAECQQRTDKVRDEGDAFEVDDIKAAARITGGTVNGRLVVAAVRQTDDNGNDYPFYMAIADLSDKSGRTFCLTSDSDFGANFQTIARILKRA